MCHQDGLSIIFLAKKIRFPTFSLSICGGAIHVNVNLDKDTHSNSTCNLSRHSRLREDYLTIRLSPCYCDPHCWLSSSCLGHVHLEDHAQATNRGLNKYIHHKHLLSDGEIEGN